MGIQPGEGKPPPEAAEIIVCLLLLRYALLVLRSSVWRNEGWMLSATLCWGKPNRFREKKELTDRAKKFYLWKMNGRSRKVAFSPMSPISYPKPTALS